MERDGLVQDVEVHLDGEIHRATYFVEGDIIHAQLGEQTYLLPLGRQPAAEMVRSLMREKLRRTGFRQALARKWYPR
ncbi:MAG: hypothetical protein ABS75_17635 [Pelagibacterium sp. SCN 63-23]|nr:MAG: hypothetical protein ABS75_17635 [Pelagibacterium sp. SCN 63-23]